MKPILSLLLTATLIEACSTTIPVRIDEALNNDRIFNYDQVNARMVGATATLYFIGPTGYEGCNVRVARDSTKFDDLVGGIGRAIPTRNLVKIEVKDHESGGVTGACLGALAGLGAGLVTGGIVTSGSSERMAYGISALAGMGVGAIGGFIIGAAEGSTQEYLFKTEGAASASHR